MTRRGKLKFLSRQLIKETKKGTSLHSKLTSRECKPKYANVNKTMVKKSFTTIVNTTTHEKVPQFKPCLLYTSRCV